MTAKTTIPISEARRRIFDLARRVQKPGTAYTITEKGRPTVVMLSADEFESLLETVETYRQFPHLDQDSKEAWAEVRQGKALTPNDLRAQKKHVAPRRPSQGKKRHRSRR